MSQPNALRSRQAVDRLGIASSTLCAVHCAIGPVLLVVLPAAALVVESPAVELAFLVATLGFGLFGIGWSGRRSHGRTEPVAYFACGAILFATGRLAAPAESLPERLLVTAGALTIIRAHLLNLRAMRACELRCAEPLAP